VKVLGAPGESKSDVARRLAERIAELEGAGGAPVTVEDLCEAWLTRSAPKRKSEKSLYDDRRLVELHVLPRFGSTKVAALTVEDVEEWLDALLETLARSTVVKIKGQLAMAFDHGIRRRHVSWNPARLAEMPPSDTRRREGRALTPSEARLLLNVADDHRLGAWITMALTMGLRPGEVSGLTWQSVDLDRGVAVIHQAVTWVKQAPTLKPATKTGKVRTLTMPPRALDALRMHRKVLAEEKLLMGDRWPARWSDLVFVTTNGTPLSPPNLRRLISRLAGEAGIEGKLTPYDLRHSATSLLSAAGVAPELLADQLGHMDTRMVHRFYRHPVSPTITVAADNIERALEA
jgi:integrase